MTPLRVCHVITRLIVGGAQENTQLTCAGLHQRGHQITLITGPDAGPEGQLLAEARCEGYEIAVLDGMHRAIRPMDDLLAVRDLARLFRRLRPDIVHTHSSKAGILGRAAARLARVPHIVHTIHGMSFNRTQPAAVRTFYRWSERSAAKVTGRIITVADAMIDQAVQARIAPRERFTTVYSGMRTDWFNPAAHDRQAVREAWGFPADAVVAGTVARLFTNKGYEQLIPAMAQAAAAEPRLHFVWVGDGNRRSDYERQLAALGLAGRTRLVGLVPPGQVPALLAGIDLLVHASQWEGLPRAAVQSLLMERPVISFAIDGAPEVVLPGQTGLLAQLNDVPGLAAAMIELARDEEARIRMGRAGRELCLERFDHRRMVDQLERIYVELVGSRR